jgi:DNA-binding SARP family transcriptional activator
MVRLQTLGELRLEGASDSALSSRRKELVLLAYLARRGPRPLGRAEAAALLWENSDERRARQSLRQALLELRRLVGDALVAGADHMALAADSVELDATLFERELDEGHPESAVARWKGEFLPGAEEIGGEELRAWLESERERLRRRLAAALAGLVADAHGRGAWREGIAWAERWTAALPLDQQGHLSRLRLLHQGGRSDEALGRLAALHAELRALDIAPIPELEQLGRVLHRAHPPLPRSGPTSAALFTPDLVGRGAAQAELDTAWRLAQSGTGGLVVVEGELGIGKTRLCEEFLRRVERESGRPLLCRARAREGAGPLEFSLLRQLALGLGSEPGISGAPATALAALAALAPAIRQRFPALPQVEWDARALPQAVREALGAVADEGPTILFVDDLPQADEASRRLLLSLVERLPPGILILTTARTGGDEPPLILPAQPSIRRLKLQPLPAADVEVLIGSILELPPEDRRHLAAQLHTQGGGNPLYVVELVSALADEGTLAPTERGAWRLTTRDRRLPLPSSVREAIAWRLARLTPPTRAVLEAAAVLALPFDRELLARVAAESPVGVENAIDELILHRLIREIGDSGRFQFAHELVRRHVERGVPVERGEELSARAFAALEEHAPHDTAARAALAHHRTRASGVAAALRKRRWRLGVAGATVVVAAAGVFAVRAAARPVLDHQLALAAPLRNQTGDPALDPIGDLAADWITQGIAQSGVLHVVAPQTLRASLRTVGAMDSSTDRQDWLEALARETGAGTIIGGSYYRAGDSLMFQLRITDGANGRVLSAPPAVLSPGADPTRALEQLRERTVGALGLLFNARLTGMNQNASRPPAYSAYKAFVEGLDLHVAYHWQEALQKYRDALTIDSTFGSPVVWSALAYWSLDDYAGCDSMLRIAERIGDRLSPFDSLLAANQRGELRGDYPAALVAAREMTRVTSGSEGYILVGQEALRLNRPHEAIEAFKHADPDRGWIKGWEGYWGHLGFALHEAGDLEAALAAAREGRHRYPSSPYSLNYEARELAALGRTGDLERVIAEALSRSVTPDWAPSVTIYEAAVELRAHGQARAAREMALRGQRNRGEHPGPAPRYLPNLDILLARLAEDWTQVERLALAMERDSLRAPTGNGFLGVLAAHRGDTAEARRRFDALARRRYAYDFGAATMWRAQIAATMGRKDEAVKLIRAAFSEGARRDRLDHYASLDGLLGYPPFDSLLRPTE